MLRADCQFQTQFKLGQPWEERYEEGLLWAGRGTIPVHELA